MTNKKYDRRNFFRVVGTGLLLGTAVLWDKLVRSEKKLSGNRQLTLPFDQTKKISFHNSFILINQNDQTKVFSSHCTHLGCVINQSKDNTLLCPCHGSTFDENGFPLTGPAIKPLKELPFRIDLNSQQITIDL